MRVERKKRIPPWGVGLIGVLLVVFGFYMAFAKKLPFSGTGYEVKAVFSNAQQIRVKSPVRIAGVNVGKVSKVEHVVTDGEGQQAAMVTMELKDDALPLKQDSTMQLRPRLFLEGNLFVDVFPGSPGSPELKDGSTLPVSQTSTSVQLDQVLSTLQAPVRADLQTFLVEFGNGLDKFGGGEGLRAAFESSPEAFRSTAEVNEAFLGTQPGDLTGLIVNLDSFIRVLDDNKVQLQDLVGNLGTVLNSFGREDQALETAVTTLPELLSVGRPALASLNNALPQLRAFSREALPGTRSAGPALDAANPFIKQLRGLVQPAELRGLTADLVRTVPSLANLSRQSLPFLEQTRTLSSCFNNVVIPWADSTVGSSDGTPVAPVYKDTGYGLAGIGGESRSGDANGQWVRTGLTLGSNGIAVPPLPGGEQTYGVVGNILGAEPTIESSAKTPFAPDVPCENQDVPNLDASLAPAPPQTPLGDSRSATTGDALPDVIKPYVEENLKLAQALESAKAESGPGSRAAEADAFAKLQAFYEEKLPLYRQALKELSK